MRPSARSSASRTVRRSSRSTPSRCGGRSASVAEDENDAEGEVADGEPAEAPEEDAPDADIAEEHVPDADAPEAEAPAAEATEDRAAAAGPTQDELRAALDRVGVADVLVEALMATVSLGFRRVSAEARDLPQAKLAIESLRALEPVLRESGVDEGLLRDLEQARMNLQLAYASAVSEEAETG